MALNLFQRNELLSLWSSDSDLSKEVSALLKRSAQTTVKNINPDHFVDANNMV
jgi:hypothetical protein